MRVAHIGQVAVLGEERAIGVDLRVHRLSGSRDGEALADQAADKGRRSRAKRRFRGGLHQDRRASMTRGSPLVSFAVIVMVLVEVSQARPMLRSSSVEDVAVPFQVQGSVLGIVEGWTCSGTPEAVATLWSPFQLMICKVPPAYAQVPEPPSCSALIGPSGTVPSSARDLDREHLPLTVQRERNGPRPLQERRQSLRRH